MNKYAVVYVTKTGEILSMKFFDENSVRTTFKTLKKDRSIKKIDLYENSKKIDSFPKEESK